MVGHPPGELGKGEGSVKKEMTDTYVGVPENRHDQWIKGIGKASPGLQKRPPWRTIPVTRAKQVRLWGKP